MHILQVLPNVELGGVERGVLDLANGLIRRGHRVTVVSNGGALVGPLTEVGAMHVTMPVHRKSPWAIAALIPELSRLIETMGIDIVHARSRVPAWSAYAAARRTQKPFLTTCHGFYKPHPASSVMTWGRTVIVPSQVLGRYLMDRFRVPAERLRVIPRGVDLSQFVFQEARTRGQEPWRVGIVGRLTALKGHVIALRALQLLVQQRLPVRLCVIGDAPSSKPQLRVTLQRLAYALGVAESVEWWGTRHDVPACLASLDVLIAPSTYPESFGRSLIEAQAVGTPVVASRLGAFAEILEDGVTGLLVPPGDFVALAEAVRRFIDDEPLRQRIIHAARRRVEAEFTLERMVTETEAVYQDCVKRPRIVIWKLGALGDAVLATPSVREIRHQYPEASIALVAGASVAELFVRSPYLNDVIVYDAKRRDRGWRGFRRVLRRLRRERFDYSIDLQNSRATHLLAWLAGVPVRAGYNRRWGRLLNRAVTLPRAPMDPVSHQHQLLREAGFHPNGTALELWPSPDDEARATQVLQRLGYDATKPLIGIHPGGSPRWKTKRWGLDRWASLCDRLQEQGAQVIVTGTDAEAAFGEILTRTTCQAPLVAIGQTSVLELACVLRRCQAFVTSDSAPLHVAAAVGTPTVALFGPTDPARHVPAGAPIRVVRHPVFCSPCYSSRCRTLTHACMKRIRVDDVLEAITDCRSRMQGSSILTRPSHIRN